MLDPLPLFPDEGAATAPLPVSPTARTFIVLGVAQPQGSTKSFKVKDGPVITTSDNRQLKPWRQAVAAEALAAGLPLLEGGVELSCEFAFARPKGHYGKRGLLPSAPRHHTVTPDKDKCVRAIGDALKGIAYRDDSQVCDGHDRKRYCREGEVPHAVVTVGPAA
jgi:crossover junction endodeoxyribonuclease RusA